MAKPHDLYVRFLLTDKADDLGKVNDGLKRLGLGGISNSEFLEHLRHIEDRVPPGILSQIESGNHSVDFMKWMREIDVGVFWDGDPKKSRDRAELVQDRKLATDINHDPSMRLTINALLMKGVEPAAIQPLVGGRYPLVVKEKHLIIYRDYFFDPARMTRQDWGDFVSGVSDQEQAIYFVALTEDLDGVKAELDLPARLNTSGVLQDLLSRSVRKAKYFLRQSSLDSNQEARAWISTVSGLVDKYEKYRKTDSTDFSKSLQMEFDYVETGFPVPDEKTLAALGDQRTKQEMDKKDPADEV